MENEYYITLRKALEIPKACLEATIVMMVITSGELAGIPLAEGERENMRVAFRENNPYLSGSYRSKAGGAK